MIFHKIFLWAMLVVYAACAAYNPFFQPHPESLRPPFTEERTSEEPAAVPTDSGPIVFSDISNEPLEEVTVAALKRLGIDDLNGVLSTHLDFQGELIGDFLLLVPDEYGAKLWATKLLSNGNLAPCCVIELPSMPAGVTLEAGIPLYAINIDGARYAINRHAAGYFDAYLRAEGSPYAGLQCPQLWDENDPDWPYMKDYALENAILRDRALVGAGQYGLDRVDYSIAYRDDSLLSVRFTGGQNVYGCNLNLEARLPIELLDIVVPDNWLINDIFFYSSIDDDSELNALFTEDEMEAALCTNASCYFDEDVLSICLPTPEGGSYVANMRYNYIMYCWTDYFRLPFVRNLNPSGAKLFSAGWDDPTEYFSESVKGGYLKPATNLRLKGSLRIPKYYDGKDRHVISYDVTLPQFASKKNPAAQRINAFFADVLKAYRDEMNERQSIVRQFITELTGQGVKPGSEAYFDEICDFIPYSEDPEITATYRIVRNDENVLSVLSMGYYGDERSLGEATINFDPQTGNIIEMDDLFSVSREQYNDRLTKLFLYCRYENYEVDMSQYMFFYKEGGAYADSYKNMLEKLPDSYYQYFDSFNDYLNATDFSDAQFLLGQKELIIIFPIYSINCGAAGTQVLTLPYMLFEDILTPEWHKSLVGEEEAA